MRARSFSVTPIRVGLDRVGVVRLRDCLEAAEQSGLEDRDALIDFMLEQIRLDNYFHPSRVDAYRVALWREYLRRRGEDFSKFYSEIPIVICGGSGKERETLARMVTTVLADHELRPVCTIAPPAEEDLEIRLEINGETVARGVPTLNGLETAVRHRLSDW